MSTEINAAEIEYGDLPSYIGKAATIYIDAEVGAHETEEGETETDRMTLVSAGVIELIQISGTRIGITLVSSNLEEPMLLTADLGTDVVKIITENRKTRS
ncbi:hypothetical protein SEA_CECE_312 [Microbacterium phage Cece]|nr:hypothetical protein SEA_CECE_10 [Microbacterium phage Cece]UVG35318.1 hypothetical protein SEA_CECE_312 [Microbacterium phage Cece]